jgi:tetratricopeptide (TPR) repeat protein
MSSQESPEAASATARVCTWAERLTELGRTAEARQVLLDALDGPGDQAPVMVALAQLEADAGETAKATELLRKVLSDDPGNVEAAYILATTLFKAGQADEAVQFIGDACASIGAVPGAVASREFAEMAGELLIEMGRHAAAVAAFGPPPALTRYSRRLRRRAWWRSGGPLRRRRVPVANDASRAIPGTGAPGIAAADGATTRGTAVAETASQPADAILETDAWAEWLARENRFDEARQVVSEAIAAHGRHPVLVVRAARSEERADAWNTALFLWREAYRQSPGDVDIVCGLAKCIASFMSSYSNIPRVKDALQVLNGFPDQTHPAIREARYEVLSRNSPSAARLAAALGPGRGLSGWPARRRRELSRRSVGPVGQFCVRVVDWVRDRHYPQPASPVQGIEAESEEIAQVLDAVRPLAPAAAREVIEDAMREHGRKPSLLLACAEADKSEGLDGHCLAVTAEAARTSGGNVDAVCALAMALYLTYGYGTALQPLASLPANARNAPQARRAAMLLHLWAGNSLLALTAVGDPRDLDRIYRKQRRRLMLNSLPQRFRPARRGDVPAMDTASFDPMSPSIAHALDQSPPYGDKSSRGTLLAAIEKHGRDPQLLLRLAQVEEAGGDLDSSAALATEAARAAPEDPLVIATAIVGLFRADHDTDALRAIDGLSGDLLTAPVIRTAVGVIYDFWRLRAHAFEAYGSSGLEAWRWRNRRVCWWQSGGPVRGIRLAITNAESALLGALEPPPGEESVLSALSLPAPTAEAIRADLASYRLGQFRVATLLPNLRDAWLERILPAAVALAIFGALAAAETLRWKSDSLAEALGVAAVATAAARVAAWVFNRFRFRVVVAAHLCLIAGIGTGAWFLLHSASQPVFGVGLALAGLAAGPFALYPLRQATLFSQRVRTARWQRSQAEAVTLNGLLSVLEDLLNPRLHRDAAKRRGWMTELERLAVGVERDLPHSLASGDPSSQRTIQAHARGAAAALRRMKETIALPNETSWRELTDQLTGLARALAVHDFSSWPAPLPEVIVKRPPRPPWRRAMDTARTVLVIFAPALGAFLLPLVLPLSGPGVPWLRFATTVWALLGIIIALDPDWSNRIAKMRQWIDLVRSATPPAGSDNGSSFYEPTPPAQPEINEVPKRLSPRPLRNHTTRSRR